MAAEIVQEERDLVRPVRRPQIVQVLFELVAVHRELKGLKMLQPVLLRNAAQHGQRGLVQLRNIDGHVLFCSTPLSIYDGLPRDHRFVDVDDTITIVLRLGELALHRS